MTKLEISKENALNAYNNGCSDVKKVLENLLGKENFKPEKITDRIKTLDDVFEAAGITAKTFYVKCATDNLDEDEIGYREVKLICKVLNEGWHPSWDDGNYKYCPYFNMSGFGFSITTYAYWIASTTVGSRLVFKSRELAEYAGKNFIESYKKMYL